MKSLLLILLASSAQALSINGVSTFPTVTATSVTIPSLGANRIVTTGAGGALVTYSTFSLTGTGMGIGTAAPGTKLHMSSGTLTLDGSNGGSLPHLSMIAPTYLALRSPTSSPTLHV